MSKLIESALYLAEFIYSYEFDVYTDVVYSVFFISVAFVGIILRMLSTLAHCKVFALHDTTSPLSKYGGCLA
jgi:hypothetical protein